MLSFAQSKLDKMYIDNCHKQLKDISPLFSNRPYRGKAKMR
jgi:hypothetical protein